MLTRMHTPYLTGPYLTLTALHGNTHYLYSLRLCVCVCVRVYVCVYYCVRLHVCTTVSDCVYALLSITAQSALKFFTPLAMMAHHMLYRLPHRKVCRVLDGR